MKIDSKLLLLILVFLSLFVVTSRISDTSTYNITSYNFSSLATQDYLPLFIIYGIEVALFCVTLFYSKQEYIWVIALIALVISSYAILYYPPDTLRGHDSWFHGSISQSILNSGHFSRSSSPVSIEYPSYYVLFSILSMGLHVPIEGLMQFLTPIIAAFFFLLLYVTLRRWIEPKWAILSVFSFFLLNRTLGDILNPGLIAMVGFVLLIYSMSFNDKLHSLLSVICIALIVSTHPTISLLSSIILVGGLFLFTIIKNIRKTDTDFSHIKLNKFVIGLFLATILVWTIFSAPTLLTSILNETFAYFGNPVNAVILASSPVQSNLFHLFGSVLQNYVYFALAFFGFMLLAKYKSSRGLAFYLIMALGILEGSSFLLNALSGALRFSLYTTVRIDQFVYFPASILLGFALFYFIQIFTKVTFSGGHVLAILRHFPLKKIGLIVLIVFCVFQSTSGLLVRGWYNYSQTVTDENIGAWNFLSGTTANSDKMLAFHPTLAFVGQKILQEYVYFGAQSFQGVTSTNLPFYTGNSVEYRSLLEEKAISIIVLEQDLNVRFYDEFGSTQTADDIFYTIQNITYASTDLVYDNGEVSVFRVIT